MSKPVEQLKVDKSTDELIEQYRTTHFKDLQGPEVPNLGFKDKEELAIVRSGLHRIATHPAISEDVIGKYEAILDQQEPLLERRRVSRRRFLFGGALLGATALLVPSAYYSCFSPEVQQQATEAERKQKIAFEAIRTLGTAPSNPSHTGWQIRYGTKNASAQYEYNGFTIPVANMGALSSSKSIILQNTGISLKGYIRSDGIFVPIARIATALDTNRYETGFDERVLREPDSVSDSVDPRVVILENTRDPISPIVVRASIMAIEASHSFEVRIMKEVSSK